MIHKKLFEFQKKDVTLHNKSENPFFKSSYSDLNEVMEAIRPFCNENKILILQTPQKGGLETTLIDLEDDTSVKSFMDYTAETTTAQKLGSNNTYNRRYSLVTMFGLKDLDDDGNVASASKPKVVVKPVAKITNQKVDDSIPF